MKNRTFLFLFLYIYLGFQNFRLIGAEDGNHGWSKIGRIKKGVKWNVLVLFIRIKMSGKEELVERNRNRSHFAAMKRTNRRMKLGKKIIWNNSSIRLIPILPIRDQFAGRVSLLNKRKRNFQAYLYRRLSWDEKRWNFLDCCNT